MQKVYGLAIEKDHGLVDLKLERLLTLAEAEKARDSFAAWGKTVLVRNRKAA